MPIINVILGLFERANIGKTIGLVRGQTKIYAIFSNDVI